MKKNYLLFLLYILPVYAFSQAGEWVWMQGSNFANNVGSFGTQGVPGPTNMPPAFYEGCEWTDLNGNLWLYGGQHSPGNFYADLWKFDPIANEWTWIMGPGTSGQLAVYGTQGIASPSNTPGARGWAPASWVDQNGNLWMFGGCDGSMNDMNDLWMYNIPSNEWTWMKGSNVPNASATAGTQGFPNIANNPAARHENACAWTDHNDNLWVFGAYAPSSVDELWRYSVSTNMWTWMKGTIDAATPAVYGTMGVEDSLNTPGSRNTYSRWVDKQGNLWLFGGNYGGSLNDLWKYDISTNNWAWMKGPNTGDDPGSYGTICTELSSNVPGCRFENRSCWTDACGNFWMFGGAHDVGTYNSYNDLWKYSPATNNWRWISGSQLFNAAGSYGTIQVSSLTNIPPSRMGSLSWIDLNGYLWLFGGQQVTSNSYYNDLWKFTIDSVCAGSACSRAVLPVASFQTSDSSLCENDCICFNNLSSGALSYQWTFAGALPATSTDQNPQTVCYLNAGSFDVTLIASNSGGNDTLTLTNYINVSAAPPTPFITQLNDTILSCSTDSDYISYQWYVDTTLIPGATDTILVINQGGNYNIQVSNKNGCSIAVGINILLGMKNYSGDKIISVSPNPATNQLTIHTLSFHSEAVTVSIMNVIGQEISPPAPLQRRGEDAVIDISGLAAGMYFLQVKSESGSITKKFVKE